MPGRESKSRHGREGVPDLPSFPRLVIAGTHSGVGKTGIAVGLMAALRAAGQIVQPFKVGPDYLDPGYHAAACGRPSWPLDSWMLGQAGVRQSFTRGVQGAEIAVIEGMMAAAPPLGATGDRPCSGQPRERIRLSVAQD